jgi:hypothetical protein
MIRVQKHHVAIYVSFIMPTTNHGECMAGHLGQVTKIVVLNPDDTQGFLLERTFDSPAVLLCVCVCVWGGGGGGGALLYDK